MTELVITVPEGMEKREWFSTSQFAKGVKSTPHAINQWIHRHPKFARKYCQNISKNPNRVKWHILWEGVAAYLSQRERFRGNQHTRSKKDMVARSFDEPKDRIAELANRQVETKTSQDPILGSLRAMVEMRESQLALENRVDTLEKKFTEATLVLTQPVEVTAGQRQLLNERVRKYCIEHDLPYHVVWRQVHSHVGLAAVHEYEYKHYAAALKYVRRMYEETGLVW